MGLNLNWLKLSPQHEDDLYCFVNGWYSFANRAEVVNNYTYLEHLSDSECDRLAKIVPGYANITFDQFSISVLPFVGYIICFFWLDV